MKLIAPCTHGVEVGHRRGLRHRKHQMSRRGQGHKRAVHSSSCLGLGPGKQQCLKSPRSHSVGACCACTSRGETEARKRDSERQNALRKVRLHNTRQTWRCANTRIVAMRGGGHRASHEAWWSRGREIGFLWWRAKKYSKHDVSTVSAIWSHLSLLLRFPPSASSSRELRFILLLLDRSWRSSVAS